MHDIDHTSHFGDAPRPDSTTLPMQTVSQPKPDATLPGNVVVGSPLGTMLNRFHSPSNSASHRRLGSGDSTYSNRVIAWDNDHPTRTVSSANVPPTPSLCGPTSSPVTYQGVPVSSQPSTPGPFSPVPFSAYRSPSITSLDLNPPPVPTRGKRPFRDTIMAVPRPLSISNKLRKKKIRPITENKAVSEPALGAPVPSFAGFSRASAGSMSNWVSWWESSSDEEEEEEEAAAAKRKKRKK
ncbi:uncharacterized protein LAJ45_03379 [Morchella importuna]|uniref:uncharacterized protein n=1 Tax=Morchella importuna TaxID=1174673 RepID=UPI001E8EA58D|nr:uncharacterized protein LAJ45_03379 [Morchella importuna]KAH8152539.1 hypothetical protein LAJ45_03379 [Morchella importuna]